MLDTNFFANCTADRNNFSQQPLPGDPLLWHRIIPIRRRVLVKVRLMKGVVRQVKIYSVMKNLARRFIHFPVPTVNFELEKDLNNIPLLINLEG